MSNHAKPAPKHRGNPRHAHLKEAPKRAARNTVILSGVALAVTGITIGGGLLGKDGVQTPTAASDIDSAVSDLQIDVDAAGTGERLPVISRSNDRRGEADPAKQAAMAPTEAAAVTESEQLSDSDPRDIARALMGDFGFSQDQFACLDSLWVRESNWNVYADNPISVCLRDPAVAARVEDGVRGERLGHEPGHPDRMGPRLHPRPLRQPLLGLGPLRVRRLVLSLIARARRSFVAPRCRAAVDAVGGFG